MAVLVVSVLFDKSRSQSASLFIAKLQVYSIDCLLPKEASSLIKKTSQYRRYHDQDDLSELEMNLEDQRKTSREQRRLMENDFDASDYLSTVDTDAGLELLPKLRMSCEFGYFLEDEDALLKSSKSQSYWKQCLYSWVAPSIMTEHV